MPPPLLVTELPLIGAVDDYIKVLRCEYRRRPPL